MPVKIAVASMCRPPAGIAEAWGSVRDRQAYAPDVKRRVQIVGTSSAWRLIGVEETFMETSHYSHSVLKRMRYFSESG